jgi:hypothetical protein
MLRGNWNMSKMAGGAQRIERRGEPSQHFGRHLSWQIAGVDILPRHHLAHPTTFPRLPRPSVAVLGRGGAREIEVEYAFSPAGEPESTLGIALRGQSLPAPSWVRELRRNLGHVAAKTVTATSDGYDNLQLIYLPASRNPLDELARREAEILVELLRAQQQQEHGHRNLIDIRNLAAVLLDKLTQADLMESVEHRVRSHLTGLSAGVSAHYSFVGGQYVDDASLGRVLEEASRRAATPRQRAAPSSSFEAGCTRIAGGGWGWLSHSCSHRCR